jgi:hypothetical protein
MLDFTFTEHGGKETDGSTNEGLVRHLPALVAVAAVITGPTPAQAAPTASAVSHPPATPAGIQEVTRKHPSDITGTFIDDHMTMVK